MLSRLKRRLFTAVFENGSKAWFRRKKDSFNGFCSPYLREDEGKGTERWFSSTDSPSLSARFNHWDSIDLERERNNSQLFAKQFSPVSITVECITPIRVERRNYDKKIQWVLGSNRVWIKPGDLVAMRQVGYRETKRFQRDERGRWLWLP